MNGDARQFDVVIVGGGPSGSSCAIRLAAAGKRVLVVEKAQFPRHKLCGEFISPEALEHFEELGIAAEINTSDAAKIQSTDFYAISGRSVSVDSDWFGGAQSAAVGLSRAKMDDLLLKRAISVGVVVWESTTFRSISRQAERTFSVSLSQNGKAVSVSSPLVVDATGRSRVIGKQITKQSPERADYVAFKAHFRNAEIAPGHCEIYSYRGGYGGCNAVEGDVFNLCFIVSAATAKRHGSDPMRLVREVVQQNSRAAVALAAAEPVTDWLAVPITRYGRHDPAPAVGVLSIGDAAAFIDPFTGSGNLLALQSARLAADEIIANADLEQLQQKYRRRHKTAFASRLNMAGMLRWAAYQPMAASVMVTALGMSKTILRLITNRTRKSPGLIVD